MRDQLSTELQATHEGRQALKRFQRILIARDHYAVAYVKRPAARLNESFSYDDEYFCSGCNVVVSKGLHQQVRRLNTVHNCDSCNRILVPFAHVVYEKEEVDPLLVSEEERIAMEERGDLGLIPACSNCGGELYEDKDAKIEITPSADFTTQCPSCHAFVVPLNLADNSDEPSEEAH